MVRHVSERVRKPSAIEVYRGETEDALGRFLAHKLDFRACISALDAALAKLVHTLPPGEVASLRAMMLADNEILLTEMARGER